MPGRQTKKKAALLLRPIAPGLLAVLIATLGAIGAVPASAEQLVGDGGFEAGTGAWTAIGGELSLVASSHSGAQAAQLSGTASYDAEIFRLIPVASLQSYELSGWVSASPQTVERALLRIHWINADGSPGAPHDSPWAPGSGLGYEYLTTGPHIAPSGTVAARISVRAVAPSLPFSVLVDDVSFEGARPDPPTPTTAPSPPPTPTPPPAEPPKPPSATATPAVLPTLTRTPTATPPQAPLPSAAPAPPATPPPTPKPTPTPGPTPGTPVVFSQLTNGGFEDDGADGAPLGWRKIGGTVRSVSSPVRSGSRALALTSETSATKWAYQTVEVDGGEFYRASAFARFTDADVEAVFMRISWYASADGSGQALSSADSDTLLDTAAPAFGALTTGPVAAPVDARSARVRLMLRPASGAQASAFFDDVAFAETSPPSPTPAATATVPPLPGDTATPDPATPAPSQKDEPLLFPALTNGSFEDVREDGTPYAWRKVGGEVAVTDTAQVDGDLALEFLSRTSSTKWAYQVVTVEAGRAYEFAGFASAGAGASQAFLRLSWYASAFGTGSEIASEDSPSTSSATAAFQHLTTGAVEAPANAHSAKLRLVLRPVSAATAIAYFDSLAFNETAMTIGDFRPAAAPVATYDGEPEHAAPVVPGAIAAAPQIANVTPAPVPAAAGAGEGDNTLLLFLGSIAVPLVGMATIGAIELSRRRTTGR